MGSRAAPRAGPAAPGAYPGRLARRRRAPPTTSRRSARCFPGRCQNTTRGHLGAAVGGARSGRRAVFRSRWRRRRLRGLAQGDWRASAKHAEPPSRRSAERASQVPTPHTRALRSSASGQLDPPGDGRSTRNLHTHSPPAVRQCPPSLALGLHGLIGLHGYELLGREVCVGVDAEVGSDGHRFARNRLRIHPLHVDQRARCRQREIPPGPDADHAVLWLDHVACPGEHQRDFGVGDDHDGLQSAQVLVGPPGLCHLDAGAQRLWVLLQLALEALEERERVGRAAREAHDHVVLEPSHLARVALHHGGAERDLTVRDHEDLVVLADAEHRRGAGERRHAQLRPREPAEPEASPEQCGHPFLIADARPASLSAATS
mmetsp:Transcript_26485/g.67152  ORF Transcript_26485/g.67152 Transcript_26485/m.67152 type:complete len:374 (+) Transcript_26485:311-1432(+)